MHRAASISLSVLCLLVPSQGQAQTATNLEALRGLAPVSALAASPEGQAALDANLTITGDIQSGRAKQPTLLPFHEQQQLALRDCFITDGNATQLADGLGTRLEAAYQGKARYTSPTQFTSAAKSVADLIAYTNNITKSDSNAGKFFFANGTTNGTKPVSTDAAEIFATVGGVADIFGKAYGRPAGAEGADRFGNSRPFQTEPFLIAYRGNDYFGNPSHTLDWLLGPSMPLVNSPSYPSGHTTYGYTESLLLALLVPERYQQMVARGAEYGNNRIVVGAHYAMDVLGGRAVAMHAVAHLLANDPAYVGPPRTNPAVDDPMGRAPDNAVSISDYRAALDKARTELKGILEAGCGDTLAACAADDQGRFKDQAAVETFYRTTQTYGLPAIHRDTAQDVGRLAPEAGYLLTAAFPSLTLEEANGILTETLGPGGGFLNTADSAFGLYSRIDLYAAAGKAGQRAAGRKRATAE